jgi:hypothetical protein
MRVVWEIDIGDDLFAFLFSFFSLSIFCDLHTIFDELCMQEFL